MCLQPESLLIINPVIEAWNKKEIIIVDLFKDFWIAITEEIKLYTAFI